MQVIQKGIPGIADDTEFAPETPRKYTKPIRKKLYDYIRGKLGMEQQGFAKLMDISPATVTQWLYTERMPNSNVLRRMATKLGLSYGEVYDLFEVKAHE